MREVVFLNKNQKKWRRIEKLLANREEADPDTLAELYIEMTDDLAYAQTNYPNSKSTEYLNGLTSSIFQRIYRRKKAERNRLFKFWITELPLIFYQSRKQLLYSFIFFSVAILIGVVSTHFDESFPRIILGDAYVDMTLENIENGDPMGVYKNEDEGMMFLTITMNNIRVSLLTFIAGLFFSIGSYYFLFQNGVMLGAFQYFFFQKGALLTSILTIWIHGTIEISCIIIAGGAGITLGNSWLYPGTFSRKISLLRGAKQGVKIACGILPLIVLAGFLEGFVTRHTEWPNIIHASIILLSLSFVIFYFVIYPRILFKKTQA